jgi:hypothetical protein
VQIYEKSEYGGVSHSFPIGDHSCDVFDKLKFHDKMMSIVIPDGLEATIYADCFPEGKQETLVGPYTSRNIQSFGR